MGHMVLNLKIVILEILDRGDDHLKAQRKPYL